MKSHFKKKVGSYWALYNVQFTETGTEYFPEEASISQKAKLLFALSFANQGYTKLHIVSSFTIPTRDLLLLCLLHSSW